MPGDKKEKDHFLNPELLTNLVSGKHSHSKSADITPEQKESDALNRIRNIVQDNIATLNAFANQKHSGERKILATQLSTKLNDIFQKLNTSETLQEKINATENIDGYFSRTLKVAYPNIKNIQQLEDSERSLKSLFAEKISSGPRHSFKIILRDYFLGYKKDIDLAKETLEAIQEQQQSRPKPPKPP